jgi:hypothetical protein
MRKVDSEGAPPDIVVEDDATWSQLDRLDRRLDAVEYTVRDLTIYCESAGKRGEQFTEREKTFKLRTSELEASIKAYEQEVRRFESTVSDLERHLAEARRPQSTAPAPVQAPPPIKVQPSRDTPATFFQSHGVHFAAAGVILVILLVALCFSRKSAFHAARRGKDKSDDSPRLQPAINIGFDDFAPPPAGGTAPAPDKGLRNRYLQRFDP